MLLSAQITETFEDHITFDGNMANLIQNVAIADGQYFSINVVQLALWLAPISLIADRGLIIGHFGLECAARAAFLATLSCCHC
jgi:hypothetical protein